MSKDTNLSTKGKKEEKNANSQQGFSITGKNNIDPALYQKSPKDYSKDIKTSNQMSPSHFTGWTPLISKTIPQDNFNFQSTTPSSSKYLNNIILNSGSHNSILPVSDIDYSNGFNLTPFLNHNINLLNSAASIGNGNANQHSHNFTSITPFHDKTLQLSDFFMESPIRGTPLKDLGSITPSKFKLNSVTKSMAVAQDSKNPKKRSILETETPNKTPHKLSITTIANDLTDEELDEDDTENFVGKTPKSHNILDRSRGVISNIHTPSRMVIVTKPPEDDNDNRDKTPSKPKKSEFITPAKPIQNSSPSTVILSSSSKTSKETNFIPNSPTPLPNKFIVKRDESIENIVVDAKPAMGTFSEPKKIKVNNNKKNHRNSKSIDMVDKSKENAELSKPRFGSNVQVNNMRFKPNNKAQMQAGMNKFQVVFSDGSGSKRGRKGKRQQKQPEKKRMNNRREVTVETQAHGDTLPINTQRRVLEPPQSTNVGSNSQQIKIIDNSVQNNSMNISGLNVSQNTEHTSFDFGALSSTPNGKFFLDKMFEKPSPQSQNLINQMIMSGNYSGMPPPQPKSQPNTNGTSIQFQQNTQVMMMSTPNHQHMYSLNNNNQNGEQEEENISLPTFSYNFGYKDSPKYNQAVVPLMNNEDNE